VGDAKPPETRELPGPMRVRLEPDKFIGLTFLDWMLVGGNKF
jgi:hypothetical protein